MRRIITALLIISSVVLVSCTPAQIAAYNSMEPEDQAKVVAELQRQQAETQFYLGVLAAEQRRLSTDCRAAMRSVWPAHLWGWADKIMHRESRYIHTAANSASSARGCFQLLLSLHGHRYYAVGCTPSQWSNALCNVKAAWHLYTAPGGGPGHWAY